jgi:hypothetical protein
MTVVDMRGKLPTNGEASYSTRPLDGITGVTVHYTASPPTTSLYSIAAYQTSEAARQQTGNGTPFPGLAYTYGVALDGNAQLAWDLETRVWHSAASVGGIARNRSNIGIVWIGDNAPTTKQVTGLAEAIVDSEKRLGRIFPDNKIEGHRDAPYPTTCPGPAWPSWRPQLLSEVRRLRAANVPPAEGNDGWQEPGFSQLYAANRSLMGKPTTGPYSDSLGNVYQDSASGTAIWNKKSNRNLFIPLDASSPIISI